MPAEFDKCVRALMDDPKFTPKEGQTKRSSAFAICTTQYKKRHNGKLPTRSAAVDTIRTLLSAVMKKEGDGEHPASHYLVVEDATMPTTWHLRVKGTDGKPDHRLMGAAWAALHGGYRGNKYEGPKKSEAIAKLRRMYKSEKLPLPSGSEVEDTIENLTLSELRDLDPVLNFVCLKLEEEFPEKE